MDYIEKIKSVSNDSKYTKWYVNICKNAVNRSLKLEKYLEIHHIVPKSFGMGGEKAENNLVELTLREHFICHYLLTKMVSDKYLKSMRFAFWCMFAYTINGNKNYRNSRLFSIARSGFIDEMRKNVGELNSFYGEKHTEETKVQMKQSRKEYIENNPEYSEICTNRFIKMWQDPELREHLTNCRNEYWSTETARDKQSKKRLEWFENPENLAKQTEINREISSRPEWREQRVANQKRLHEDPEYTKIRIDAMHTPEAKAKSRESNLAFVASMTEDERKIHFGKGNINTRCITDGKDTKKLKNGSPLPEGWNYGTAGVKGRRYYFDPVAEVQRVSSDPQDGWILWDELSDEQKLKFKRIQPTDKKTVKGSIWITDGCMSVKLGAGLSVPEGWNKGRTFKSKITQLGTI